MFGKAAYQDRDMVVGQELLNECDMAVPVSWAVWQPKRKKQRV